MNARASDPLPALIALVADRDETKYFFPRDAALAFAREVARRLAPHRYTGERANTLPHAHHFVTTIYFDTPSRAHFAAAQRDPTHNVKLRAKEYYDVHPSLAELATSPSEIIRSQPWLWLELKRREGARSRKLRWRLLKRDAAALFAGEAPPAAESPEAIEIVDYCRGLNEHLEPSCVVNYRRAAYQDADAGLRVTLDAEIAYFAPLSDLWAPAPLERGRLGTPRAIETGTLVEIKSLRGSPDWLNGALADAGVPALVFSKFAKATQVVHGG
jgi:VTC domain-containing protein